MPEARVSGQSVRRSLHRRASSPLVFTGQQTLVQLWLGACGRSASPVAIGMAGAKVRDMLMAKGYCWRQDE